MRKLTFEQLQRMSDAEVAEYWTSGVLPESADLPLVIPSAQGRSMLEAAERRWATGRE